MKNIVKALYKNNLKTQKKFRQFKGQKEKFKKTQIIIFMLSYVC